MSKPSGAGASPAAPLPPSMLGGGGVADGQTEIHAAGGGGRGFAKSAAGVALSNGRRNQVYAVGLPELLAINVSGTGLDAKHNT